MVIYISRPGFRGRLRRTSKGAPVSGRSDVSALQEHEPAHALHSQGKRQAYKGVGWGEEFLSTRPSTLLLPAELHPTSENRISF